MAWFQQKVVGVTVAIAMVPCIAPKALSKLGDTRAVDPLIAALQNEDVEGQRQIIILLGRITGRHFGEDQDRWQQWWEENKDEMLESR